MGIETCVFEIVKFLNCMFEVYLVYYFLESIFQIFEDRKYIRYAEIVLAAMLIYGINRLRIPWLNLSGVLVVDIMLGWMIYRKQLKILIPYTTIGVIILAATEFVFHYLYRVLEVNIEAFDVKRMLLLMIQNVFRYMLIEMLRQNKSELWQHGKKVNEYVKYLFLLPVATIILLNGIIYIGHEPMGYLLICVGGVLLVLSNISSFIITEKSLKSIEEAKEAKELALKTQLEQRHYQRIEEINHEYARYAHEIRKAVRTVQELAKKEDNESIDKITTQLLASTEKLKKKIYCEDKVMNAILIERQRIAAEKRVSYSVQIQSGIDFSFIGEMEKIVLFGNLLDNAIEAASTVEEGYVMVDFYMGNQALMVLRIENNYGTKPEKKHGKFITIKKERGHGHGLNNVQAVAEKYSGGIYTEEEGDAFITVLTLSNR